MAYSISQNRLQVNSKPVKMVKSPFTSGNFAKTPKIVVMHFTFGASAASSATWFQSPDNPGSSAQVVIDRDGTVIQCVDFDIVAWHAGKSRLRDIVGLNKHAIGIEMANWGYLTSSGSGWKTHSGKAIANPVLAVHENGNPDGSQKPIGWEPYPQAQFDAAVGVVRALVKEYGINEIVGHEDISKGRKWDPGPAFNKQHFRDLVFGGLESDGDHRFRVTASEGLNLRSGPGQEYAAKALLPANTIVDPISLSGKWMNVSVIGGNGQPTDTGFVHSSFLAPV